MFMHTESTLASPNTGGKKRRLLRPFILVIALVMASLIGWMFWPANPESSPYDLSRADGKPRLYATTLPKKELPPNLSLLQKLYWRWMDYKRRHGGAPPRTYVFPASPVRPCGIQGLLNQCMEVTGKQYFIAVDIAGSVKFGNTNALNGQQWVAAFERAIETSDPVVCYDYGKKRNFEDTLLVIRECPDVVKVIPGTKLGEYQRAGLVKVNSQ
jgi:hypothetical protein